MKPLTQFAVIVRIPKIYIATTVQETGWTKNQTIDQLIRTHTDVKLPYDVRKSKICEFEYKEEFETNSLLVCITSLEPIPGLWELGPGYNIPYKSLTFKESS